MLSPVVLMQRLDSSLDPTLVACELPWFLGIPRDFSEKSWFCSFLSGVPLQGPPYRGAAESLQAVPPRLWGLGWLQAWLGFGGWALLIWLGLWLGFGLILLALI